MNRTQAHIPDLHGHLLTVLIKFIPYFSTVLHTTLRTHSALLLTIQRQVVSFSLFVFPDNPPF